MSEKRNGQSDVANRDRLKRTPNDRAAERWASPLTIVVFGSLVVEALTGLWIYLAPFSVASQLQVILHTVLGLVLVGAYVYYQTRHFLDWYRQKLTAVMILGYSLMTMIVVCIVTGLVLTWESIVGPKISSTWDLAHLVAGIVGLALLVAHPLLAFSRRRLAARRIPNLAMAFRRFSIGGAGFVGILVGSVAVSALAWPKRQAERPVPEDYSLPEYLQAFDEYRGNPFAPSYARTEGNMFVNPEILSNSEGCGSSGCHEQILEEWQPSAHRFSAMNPPFQEVQKNFARQRSGPETRYCAGCHDPISLFAGAKDIHNADLSAPGMREGISCAVCHTMSRVDRRGNADYVLSPPDKYIWEHSEGMEKFVSDFLIRAYPRQHLEDYDRALLRTPEACGACHKQFIPEALNRFGLSPGQNQYDEWKESHWNADDPEGQLTCRQCHMRLVRDSDDPGRGEEGDDTRSSDDRAHRHHGFVATNLYMPMVLELPNWEEHVRLTREWIRGETRIPEIQDRWLHGPVASIDVVGPDTVRAGQDARFTVLVKNRKAGHNLTTGPLDFMRVWVHLRVTDSDGRLIAEWGALHPETRMITDEPGEYHRVGNSRSEGTLVLEGMPTDSAGRPLREHQLWDKAGGKGQRVIFPGYTDRQTYETPVPASAGDFVTVTAELNFRRYRQEFLDLVVPKLEEETGFHQPTVTKATASKRVAVQGPVAGQR